MGPLTAENCYLKRVTIADDPLLAAKASAAVYPIPHAVDDVSSSDVTSLTADATHRSITTETTNRCVE